MKFSQTVPNSSATYIIIMFEVEARCHRNPSWQLNFGQMGQILIHTLWNVHGYHNKTTDDLCLVQSESNFAKTKQSLSLVSHHYLYPICQRRFLYVKVTVN